MPGLRLLVISRHGRDDDPKAAVIAFPAGGNPGVPGSCTGPARCDVSRWLILLLETVGGTGKAAAVVGETKPRWGKPLAFPSPRPC